MKLLRLAAIFIGLSAALVSLPAQAGDANLSVQLNLGWDGTAQAGGWIPYQVTIRNDSLTQDFKGGVVIHGQGPGNGPAVAGPRYEQPVTVAKNSQKQLTIYGAYLDSSSGVAGYVAELENASGEPVARSPLAGLSNSRLAVGLLSDSQSAAGQIKDVRFYVGSPGVVQLNHQGLPASAVEMAGLSAIVVDHFDSSTLSQAQDLALEQYVAMGGSLVLAAGSGWRRTLGQLPQQLVPLKPAAVVSTSLDPVMDLRARHTTLQAEAARGALAAGARTVLNDADGVDPLLVELGYGAGRVLELAYDPTEDPVAGHADEVEATWAAVLGRVVTNQAGPYGPKSLTPLVLSPVTTRAIPQPSSAALDDLLASLLNDTPANSLPPVGLLGGLLVLYVLLAGPINYAVLRGFRKREAMWVTVPLISLTFTGAAYGAGVAVHGRDYYVNEIQILRVSPAGGIDVASYDAVFSPGRGNVAIQLGESSVASTVVSTATGLSSSGDDRVVSAAGTLVDLRNLAIWTPRDFKSESPARAPIQVQPHLRLAGNRILGTISNPGRATLRRVEVTTTDGRYALLAASIPAGTTVEVNASLKAVPQVLLGGVSCNRSGCLQSSAGPNSDREGPVLAAASAAVVSPENQVQALAGLVEPVPGFRVNGSQPNRTVIAAFVLPFAMDSVDSLTPGWSAPRLVAGNGLAGTPVSVVDYELPHLPAGAALTISAGNASSMVGGASVTRPSIQLYDWSTAGWVTTDLSHPFALSAGERGPDLVRLRIQGSLYLQGFQVVSR